MTPAGQGGGGTVRDPVAVIGLGAMGLDWTALSEVLREAAGLRPA